MSLMAFGELMAHAESEGYAVGYFESWNLESLLAVADAAERARSPVILGFSGICLPNEKRVVKDRLSHYAALGRDVCRRLTVPACLLFNESAYMSWVLDAIDLGFDLVMFTDENLDYQQQKVRVRQVADRAHAALVAIEAEIAPLPGAGGEMIDLPDQPHLTDPAQAAEMVETTGVDALAVDIGQVHLHGRIEVNLDMQWLGKLRQAVGVPLVLHGASSVAQEDLVEAVRQGIRKINVGSNLKRAYFEAMRRACMQIGAAYNPYDVIGSGLSEDVLAAGRLAMQKTVEELMHLFGSAGKARKMEGAVNQDVSGGERQP